MSSNQSKDGMVHIPDDNDSETIERRIASMQDEIDRLRRIEVEYATVKKMYDFTHKMDLEG